jgi:hypothetical protein
LEYFKNAMALGWDGNGFDYRQSTRFYASVYTLQWCCLWLNMHALPLCLHIWGK